MATGGPPGRGSLLYEEDDRVNEILLNHLSKWILYSRLGSLARSLGIGQAEFERIQGAHPQPRDQMFQVLLKWFHMRVLTVRDLVSEMVDWTENRFLDPEVWNNFRSKISPAALPANIETLAIPAPPGDETDIQPTTMPQPIFHLHNHLHVHPATHSLDGTSSLRPNEAIAHTEGTQSVYLPEDEDPLTTSRGGNSSSVSPTVEITGSPLSLHLPNDNSSTIGARPRHPPLRPSQPPRSPIPEALFLEARQRLWEFQFSLLVLALLFCLGLGPAIEQGLNRQSRETHPEDVNTFNSRLPETAISICSPEECRSMFSPFSPDEEMSGSVTPGNFSFRRSHIFFISSTITLRRLAVCFHALLYASRAELDRHRGHRQTSSTGSVENNFSSRQEKGLGRERVDLQGRGKARHKGREAPAWWNPFPHRRGGTQENPGQLGAPHGAFEYVVEFVCLVYALIIIIYTLLQAIAESITQTEQDKCPKGQKTNCGQFCLKITNLKSLCAGMSYNRKTMLIFYIEQQSWTENRNKKYNGFFLVLSTPTFFKNELLL